jgi:hypothetical protein
MLAQARLLDDLRHIQPKSSHPTNHVQAGHLAGKSKKRCVKKQPFGSFSAPSHLDLLVHRKRAGKQQACTRNKVSSRNLAG